MSRTCAVVVTYHPKLDVLYNLSALRPQVDSLVIVDNGSNSEARATLTRAAEQLDFTLICNRENLGIAAALNLGARRAQAQGFEFVIFFDQDSTVSEGFVAALLASYQEHPRREDVAIVTSHQRDRGLKRLLPVPFLADGSPMTAITSGSLMPLSVFHRCGWFEEQLIIDWVDVEYCLRVRKHGFILAFCDKTTLLVSIGAAEEHRLLGHSFCTSHHSAKRRYYMARNRLVTTARWWRDYPVWSLYSLRDLVFETMGVLLFERQRGRKLINTMRGVLDACLGRMGKVVEL